MNTYKEQYPKLYQFIGSYFHPNWMEEFQQANEAPAFVSIAYQYKAAAPPATISQVAKEIEKLLALPISDSEVDEAVQRLGSAYNPQVDGFSRRMWLEELLRILR